MNVMVKWWMDCVEYANGCINLESVIPQKQAISERQCCICDMWLPDWASFFEHKVCKCWFVSCEVRLRLWCRRQDTLAHMTTPQQMRKNLLQVLEFLVRHFQLVRDIGLFCFWLLHCINVWIVRELCCMVRNQSAFWIYPPSLQLCTVECSQPIIYLTTIFHIFLKFPIVFIFIAVVFLTMDSCNAPAFCL